MVLEVDAEVLEADIEALVEEAEVLEADGEVPEADAEVLQTGAAVLDTEALVEEAEVLEAEGEVPEADPKVLQAKSVVLEAHAEVLEAEGEVLVDEPEVLEAEADEMMTIATSEVTKPAKADVVGSENPEVSGPRVADTVSVGTTDHGDDKGVVDVESGEKVGDAEAKVAVADDLSEADEAEVIEETDLQMWREREGRVDKASVHDVTMVAADTELPEPITADEVVKAADTTVTGVVDAGEAEEMQSAAAKDVEGGDSQSSKSAGNKFARTTEAEIVTISHTTVAGEVNQGEKGEESDAKQPKSAGDSESAVENGAESEAGAGNKMVEVTGDAEVVGSTESKTSKAADVEIA